MSRFHQLLVALILLVLAPLGAGVGAGSTATDRQDLTALGGPERTELRGWPGAPVPYRVGTGERKGGPADGPAPSIAVGVGHPRAEGGCLPRSLREQETQACRPLSERLPYDATAPPASRQG
jgi:hypothetical protein